MLGLRKVLNLTKCLKGSKYARVTQGSEQNAPNGSEYAF